MTDSTNMYMPVAPAYGGGNGGFGGFGDGNGWWVILLILLCGGAWGGGFGGFGGGNGMFPWMMAGQGNTNNDIQRGFDQSALMTGITGVSNAVTSGFGDIQTALCGGFAGVNAGIANGFAQSEIAANSRQMANMNQNFALQTGVLNGFNTLGSQLSSCCCENRLATANQTAALLAEHCADRQALSDGIRDVLANQNNGIQKILDKMCEQEIENLKAANSSLQTQVLMRDLAASQTAQTAALVADNTAQTQYIVNRVAPYPIPAYTVPNPLGTGTATAA